MTDDHDARWADAQRIEGWAGEVRVNLIRLAALLVFYGQHLLNVYFFRDDPAAAGAFHVVATALVLAWGVGVFVLHLCLSRRWVPPALKYVATLGDVAFVTLLLVAAGGPRSPLVVLYFLVVAAAALRLSLPLVYAATGAAVAGYLVVLAHYAWFVVGTEKYYAAGSPERIPRTHQIIFILALVTTGFLAGQYVRLARRLAEGYPVSVRPAGE